MWGATKKPIWMCAASRRERLALAALALLPLAAAACTLPQEGGAQLDLAIDLVDASFPQPLPAPTAPLTCPVGESPDGTRTCLWQEASVADVRDRQDVRGAGWCLSSFANGVPIGILTCHYRVHCIYRSRTVLTPTDRGGNCFYGSWRDGTGGAQAPAADFRCPEQRLAEPVPLYFNLTGVIPACAGENYTYQTECNRAFDDSDARPERELLNQICALAGAAGAPTPWSTALGPHVCCRPPPSPDAGSIL